MSISGVQTVLITGGAGFIGSHLAEALLKLGHHITVIDDVSTGRFENIAHLTNHPHFRFTIDSVYNQGVIDRLVSECDLIFHLASVVGVELTVRDPVMVMEANMLSTHAVLKAANRYRKKILIASSSEVYGKNDHIPLHEDDYQLLPPTTQRRWSYSISKAAGEILGLSYHQQLGLPVIVVRLFNTVGPRQTGHYGMVMPRLVQQALRGEPVTVYGDGRQTRCFCNVKDVVRALMGLAECPEAVGQVFNVGSTEEISILGLAHKIIQMTDNLIGGPASSGCESERIKMVPYEQAYGMVLEDIQRRVPDISKIHRFTGWVPTCSLDDTLTDIINSFAKTEAIQRHC